MPLLTFVLRKIASLLFTVPALGLGVLLWGSAGEGDVSNQMHRVLPLIVLGIGSGLCLLYGRVRVLLLLYASQVLLQAPVAHFQRTGMLLPATQVIFHSISLWLPVLFAGMAFWPERGRPRRDIGLRCLALACVLLPFSLLAQQHPEGMQRMISDVHWPALQTDISALAQLPGWLFLLLGAALGWRAHRRRRPSDIVALLALLCMYVMLPRIFMTPAVLVTAPLVAMALLICAVVQEAFDLAFRDDLTGLPGRRALNEALKRVGNQYTIAMVDVDHFKKFNDTHGHDAGDEVLKLVSSRLARVGAVAGRSVTAARNSPCCSMAAMRVLHARRLKTCVSPSSRHGCSCVTAASVGAMMTGVARAVARVAMARWCMSPPAWAWPTSVPAAARMR